MTPIRGPQIPPSDLSIQPCGMLVAVVEADLRIVHLSENCAHWLGQSHEQLIGCPLDVLLAERSVVPFKQCVAQCSETASVSRLFDFAVESPEPVTLSACMHRAGSLVIIELERPPASPTGSTEAEPTLIGECRVASQRLAQCESVHELSQVAVQTLRMLTGYDRVALCQFDEQWNRAVVTEECGDHLMSCLGIRFPASDIPESARSRLLFNGLRTIPDTHYSPVAVFPAAQSGEPLDLSRAHLRSASPVQLEYLRSMGVGASVTISLVIDGTLWGLIACHHHTVKPISSTLREFCHLFGQMVSMQLSRRIQIARYELAKPSMEVLRRLADRVEQSQSIVAGLLADENDLLALTHSQGAVLWRDGEATAVGVTPPLKWISEMKQWVSQKNAEPIFVTDCLAKHLPGADAQAAIASGMLALAITRAPDVYVFWFRPEVVQIVQWAGDLSSAQAPRADEHPIQQRQTFGRWQESVSQHSLPWLDGEIEAARRLRTILQKRLMRTAERLDRLLPICAWCKKVRADKTYWQQLDVYLTQHTDIRFTHGMCPECFSQKTAHLKEFGGDSSEFDSAP